MQEIVGQSWTNDLYQWTGYANGTQSYTANGLNQYTTAAGATLTHDAKGNLTGDGVWPYAFDADNKHSSSESMKIGADTRRQLDRIYCRRGKQSALKQPMRWRGTKGIPSSVKSFCLCEQPSIQVGDSCFSGHMADERSLVMFPRGDKVPT